MGAMEIRGGGPALLDEPPALRARGGGEGVVWRARYKDDDDRIWKANALRPEDFVFGPGKPGTAPVAALQSLRPLRMEIRCEAPDGRAASMSVTRLLLGEGVKARRWRDGMSATLYLPAVEQPAATLLIGATQDPGQLAVATPAAALLASRGVLVLVLAAGRNRAQTAASIGAAAERLAGVPGAGEVVTLEALLPGQDSGKGVVLAPGIGAVDEAGAPARALRWAALREQLGVAP